MCKGKDSFVVLAFVGNSERFNEEYRTSKRARPYREDSLEDIESEKQEVVKAEENDSWVKREWVNVAPGGEAVDLEDLVPEIDRATGGLIGSHPANVNADSARREGIRQFVQESSSFDAFLSGRGDL